MAEFRRDPLPFIFKVAELQEPIVRVTMAGSPQWIVFDADIAREVLQQQAEVFARPWITRFVVKDGPGNNLFSSLDQDRARRRSALQPHLSKNSVLSRYEAMVHATDSELKDWPKQRPIDVQAAATSLSLRLAGEALFGLDIGNHPQAAEISDAFGRITRFYVWRLLKIATLPTKIPTRRNLALQADVALVKGFVGDLIAERRANPLAEPDVLQSALEAAGQEGGLSIDELATEAVVLLLQGQETTAAILTWAMFELAKNQELQHDVHAEICRVVGPEKPPTTDEVNRMPLLNAVVEETLRLYTTGWVLPRVARRKTQIGGYTMRKWTGVMIASVAIHRDASVWDSPLEFRPQRFLHPSEPAPKPPLPYGLGPQHCIGSHLANLKIRLMLTRLLQQSHVCDPPPRTPSFSAGFSLHFDDGLPLTIEPR